MSGVDTLAISIFFLYLLPWFGIHSWLIVTRGKTTGGWGSDVTILTFIFGVIPLTNIFVAIYFLLKCYGDEND